MVSEYTESKQSAPISIPIFGSKSITSKCTIIQMMCPCRKIILSLIRMPWIAWNCIGIFVNNYKFDFFLHKLFLKTVYPGNNVHLIFIMLKQTKQNIIKSCRKYDLDAISKN